MRLLVEAHVTTLEILTKSEQKQSGLNSVSVLLGWPRNSFWFFSRRCYRNPIISIDISLSVSLSLSLTHTHTHTHTHTLTSITRMQSAKSGLCQMLRAHDILYSAKNCKEQAVTHEEPRDWRRVIIRGISVNHFVKLIVISHFKQT